MFGSGKCAAFRAYKSIYKLACIEQYISDKVSGRRPLAINLINGVNAPQLKSILDTAQSEADARGIIAYMGAIIAAVAGDTTPGVATIPLADFPDNFNRRDELDIAVLAYANNLGLDVQDSTSDRPGARHGRTVGSAQREGQGQGPGRVPPTFVHATNTWVLPDATTLEFVEKDWRISNSRRTSPSYGTALR
jgi:hypothetical protein